MTVHELNGVKAPGMTQSEIKVLIFHPRLLSDLVPEQKSETEALPSRIPVPHGEKSHHGSSEQRSAVTIITPLFTVLYNIVIYCDILLAAK